MTEYVINYPKEERMKKLVLAVIILFSFQTSFAFGQCPTNCRPDAGDDVVEEADAGDDVVEEAGSCSTCEISQSCGAAGSCGADPISKVEKVKAEPEGGRMNVHALDAMIQAQVPVVILDARAGKFDDGKRIPGAKSLNSESKDEEVAKVIPNKDSLIVTYCVNTGCKASSKLAEHLKEIGYTNVIEFPIGIEGWIAAGKKVESVAK